MLIFIIPLRDPERSGDWQLVCRLCERTVRSICQQTDDAFRVLVVGSVRPPMDYDHPNLVFVTDSFPPLNYDRQGAGMVNMTHKLQRGLIEASAWAPDYWMTVNDDDCISSRIAAFAGNHHGQSGWYVHRGYLYQQGSRFVYLKRNFHLVCGSSVILPFDRDQLPRSMDDSFEEFPVLNVGHNRLVSHMAANNTPLRPLPFRGAIWNVGTSENTSKFSMGRINGLLGVFKKLLFSRPLTPSIRREFGLVPLPDNVPN